MSTVCIGVHVHAQPGGLLATLASLQAGASQSATVVLLPDGPDQATQQALDGLRHLPQLGTSEPKGAAACFNRLVTSAPADVYILLESGCVVGPGWLERLLAALAADPRHGLAGPSTNRSWNEQGVFPAARGSPAEVEATAREALRRFGSAWRTLEPLYSLADFCYAVKREVVEAIGAADEGYDLGPCWEMDYNIRGARAGFHGVWACAAYVWRPPFTERRRREEAARFTASKQRYQDKFCALRLRGERPGYEPHCRGDACEHFAPPGLIRLHLPLPAVATASEQTDPKGLPSTLPHAPTSADASPATPGTSLPPATHAVPLVSCIMPTRNRRDYVLQSIRYLQRQDYPTWELIILDDGDDGLADCLPADPRLRYQPVRRGLSIGAKRNQGCNLARGEIIAQWDDDDWYGPQRLSVQVAPLLAGQADISALDDTVFCDLPRWRFWRCTPALHRRLFVEDVHGGTLVYWRELWQRSGGYPDRSLAEDAWFLRLALRQGGRLARLSGLGHFVYLRHGANAWAFACGQYLDPTGWQRVDEPSCLAADRTFYALRSTALSSAASSRSAADEKSAQQRQPAAVAPPCDRSTDAVGAAAAAPSPPLISLPFPPFLPSAPVVSCIMPTANRRRFVAQAIRYFQRQDYPRRELLVVDDGADPVADLVPDDPAIRYLRLPQRLPLGAKRNLACEAAQGEIIVHWDDDDWQAGWRLSYQVQQLLAQQADVCGVDKVWYYQPSTGRGWQYVYPPGGLPWVAGNSLCYRRDFWRRNPFPAVTVGEDSRFLWSSQPKRLVALPDNRFLVGLVHPGNTSVKRTTDRRWQPCAAQVIAGIIGDDWEFYRA